MAKHLSSSSVSPDRRGNRVGQVAQSRGWTREDYETPVFEPGARRLLAWVEPMARHYEVRLRP
jgi:hypothetical protein